MAVTLELLVRARDEASGVIRKVGAAGTQLGNEVQSVTNRTSQATVAIKGWAQQLGLVFGGALIVKGLKDAIGQAEEAQRVGRQTAAVLKSTGGEAGVSAGHVEDLAQKLSDLAAVDDEVIQQGENVLLTFSNVRNEVGRGNDIFDQATQSALDLSAGMGQDLQSSIVMVGKALDNPIKGLSALSRVGVSFRDSEREQIATMVQHNDVIGAQKVILEALRRQFQGDAAANATSSRRMSVAFGNVEESLGTALLPMLGTAADVLDSLSPLLETVASNVGVLFGAFAAYKAVQFMPTLLQGVGLGLDKIGAAKAAGAMSDAAGSMDKMKGLIGGAAALGIPFVVGALDALGQSSRDAQKRVEAFYEALKSGKSAQEIQVGVQAAIDDVVEASGGLISREQILTAMSTDLANAQERLAREHRIAAEQTRFKASEDGRAAVQAQIASDNAKKLTQSVDKQSDVVSANTTLTREARFAHSALNRTLDSYRVKVTETGATLVHYRRHQEEIRQVLRYVNVQLRNGKGAYADIRAEVDKTGRVISTWAGMTRREVQHWASGVVDSAREAISAFADYTRVTQHSADEAVKNAQKQVGAAKQYRDGAKAIIDSDYPAKIKKQVLDAGPEIVRQWAEMSDRQRKSFVDALTRTTAIMEQTRKMIVDKIGAAMDEVERETSKTIKFTTDVDSSLGTAHLHAWLREVQSTKVTIPVDAIFSAAGGSVPGHASGGRLPGYGGGDTVPAMLEPGEWVINKAAVAKYGDGLLDKINRMHFAGGGAVDDHNWGLTYTLSHQDLYGAVVEAARERIKSLFPEGSGPGGLTAAAGRYFGAIQALFHPAFMSTGPSVRKIIGTDTWSQHAYGNALDITNSFASGPDSFKQSIANWLAEMGRLRRDIHYIAYNHRGWTLDSPWTAGVTSSHTNHVHMDPYPQWGGTPPGHPVGRAQGGPVSAGRAYRVLELGVPEVIVPAGDGWVHPLGGRTDWSELAAVLRVEIDRAVSRHGHPLRMDTRNVGRALDEFEMGRRE